MPRIQRPLWSLLYLFLLAACGTTPPGQSDVSSAQVQSVADIPPSVFAPTPSATAELTPTELPPPPTPTSTAVPASTSGTVTKDANVRDQPTTTGSTVLGQVKSGTVVELKLRNDTGSWYVITAPSGLAGWMSATLLQIDPTVASTIQVGTPTPDDAPPVASDAYPVEPTGLETAAVISVIDGDTIGVQLADQVVRVRMIGIDTPETKDPRTVVQCFGREASAEAERRLTGQTVALEADPTQDNFDKYGRLLRYAWLPDGKLYNLEMLIGGFAHEYTYNLPYRYQAAFKKAEHDARERGWGLWAQTTCNGDTTQPADGVVSPSQPEPTKVPAPSRPAPTKAPVPSTRAGCDPSYPDVCIPPYPPDLDCGDIPFRRFRVLPPDRHRFDGDHDGIGCER